MDEMWNTLPSSTGRATGRPDLTLILPTLLVGEYPRPEDVVWLAAEHGVRAIVNLQDDEDLRVKGIALADLQRASAACGIVHHHFPIPDFQPENLRGQLEGLLRLLAELDSIGSVTYLHCNAGFNRAPTVAIAYLHVRHGMPLSAACDHVKAQRPCGPYMQLLVAHFGECG